MHFVQKCEKKRKEIYCDNMIITSITFIFIYITNYYYLNQNSNRDHMQKFW